MCDMNIFTGRKPIDSIPDGRTRPWGKLSMCRLIDPLPRIVKIITKYGTTPKLP